MDLELSGNNPMTQSTQQLIEEAVKRFDNQFGNTELKNKTVGYDASRRIKNFIRKELSTIASKSAEAAANERISVMRVVKTVLEPDDGNYGEFLYNKIMKALYKKEQ